MRFCIVCILLLTLVLAKGEESAGAVAAEESQRSITICVKILLGNISPSRLFSSLDLLEDFIYALRSPLLQNLNLWEGIDQSMPVISAGTESPGHTVEVSVTYTATEQEFGLALQKATNASSPISAINIPSTLEAGLNADRGRNFMDAVLVRIRGPDSPTNYEARVYKFYSAATYLGASVASKKAEDRSIDLTAKSVLTVSGNLRLSNFDTSMLFLKSNCTTYDIWEEIRGVIAKTTLQYLYLSHASGKFSSIPFTNGSVSALDMVFSLTATQEYFLAATGLSSSSSFSQDTAQAIASTLQTGLNRHNGSQFLSSVLFNVLGVTPKGECWRQTPSAFGVKDLWDVFARATFIGTVWAN